MNELRQKTNMVQNYSVKCLAKTENQDLLQIKVKWLALITLFGVLSTFIFCILWTIIFKLDDATSTHCGYQVGIFILVYDL